MIHLMLSVPKVGLRVKGHIVSRLQTRYKQKVELHSSECIVINNNVIFNGGTLKTRKLKYST